MKRWLVGLLLVVLAGVLLVVVINSNRDPIAALEMRGALIARNGEGAVVRVGFMGRLHSDADWVQHFVWALGFTSPSDADLVNLDGLTALQHLDLQQRVKNTSKITDAGLVHLKAFPNLQELRLWGTPITDAGLVHLKGLTNLQILYFDKTPITGAGLVHLKELSKLQTLGLWGSQITDPGLVHLKGMTNLQTLILWDTRITDAGLVHLRGLTSLVRLEFVHPGNSMPRHQGHRCGGRRSAEGVAGLQDREVDLLPTAPPLDTG